MKLHWLSKIDDKIFAYPQISHEEQDSASALSSQIMTNNFPFQTHEEKEDNFDVAVCGPAVYYYNDDISKQLVEWFTILQALNVSKVFIYELNVHPNVQRILNYYEKNWFASIIKFTNPTPLFSTPAIVR